MNALLRTAISPILVVLVSTSIVSLSYSHAHAQSDPQQSSETKDNNAFIIALAAGGLATLAAIIAAQAAQEVTTPSFGGKILTITPPGAVCAAPPASLITIAGVKSFPLMYMTPGSLSYSFGPPVAPGQSIVGRAGITPVPCVTPTIPPVVVGGGLPILFHGSSVPGSI